MRDLNPFVGCQVQITSRFAGARLSFRGTLARVTPAREDGRFGAAVIEFPEPPVRDTSDPDPVARERHGIGSAARSGRDITCVRRVHLPLTGITNIQEIDHG